MSKPKWMRLLIGHRWGTPSVCSHHMDRPSAYVIHYDFRPLDLRDFYRQYGEEEFPKAQQRSMRKVHPKQAEERFICVECHRSVYLADPARYSKETGQADFTSVTVDGWRTKAYRTVEEAVMDFLIKKKGK